ncbi:MAG: CHASE domain-containing protein [Methylophaga sp.]|nr:CHASE domain-containing protein [Methylophaga sp.]
MNVVKKITKIVKQLRNDHRKFLLPLLILFIGIAFSLQQYWSARQQAEATLQARFTVAFNEATLNIIEKIEAYEQMLRAAQGLFYASDAVSRQEFHLFAKKLELAVHYPGILGLGYVPLIKPEDRAKHIAKTRESGFPDYQLYPEGERDFYTSIFYLEPFSERNLRAFGFDMAAEPNRREAMLRARDQQQVALSAGVKLVQDLSSETTTGLLMYLPLFKDVSLLGGQKTQRQLEHHGWVYAVFRIDDVVNNSLDVSRNTQQFRITDITTDNQQTLFQTPASLDSRVSLRKTATLAGRLWQFEAAPDNQFIANYKTGSPLRGLLIGILFSAALAYISWLIMSGRIRAELFARQMTGKLREQNQRLSLASETARMGVWDWDFASNMLFLDNSLAKLMGVTVERLSYQDWLQRIVTDDQQRLDTAISKAISQRQELNIQVQIISENDLTRVIQLNAALKYSNDSQPLGMLGVSFDITDSWLHQQQLAQTEARWKHALEGSGEGVWDWSIVDDNVIFSDKLLTMLGFEPGEFRPHLSEWTMRVHPDDKPQVDKDIQALLDGSQQEYRNEHRVLCKGGRWKWILDRGTVIERGDEGEPLRAVGTHSDISWRKEAEIRLRQSEEQFRNAFDTAAIGMALVSANGRWLKVNDALCKMLGYQENELLALTFMDITYPDDLDLDQQFVNKLIKRQLDSYQIEKRYFHKNGQIIDVLLSVSVVHDAGDNVAHFICQIDDITARKHELERIVTLAFHDTLTGLPNRRLFDERINHALLSARRNQHKMALMFIDVDHFKQINDSYGHDVGDAVIKTVGDKMQGLLRASDTLARFGGDEFLVLLEDVPSDEVALRVADNLRQPFTEMLQLESCVLRITLSIGVAIWTPEQVDTVFSLMKKADMALYEVKARGRDGVGLYQSVAD